MHFRVARWLRGSCCRCDTGLTSNWSRYFVRFSNLNRPSNVNPVGFDASSVVTINFAANTPAAAFDFWIDDITLYR